MLLFLTLIKMIMKMNRLHHSSLRMTLLLGATLFLMPACQQQDVLTKTDDTHPADTWTAGLTYTSTVDALVDDRPMEVLPQKPRSVYDNKENTETYESLPFTLEPKTYKSTRKDDKDNPIETHTHIVPKVEFDRTIPSGKTTERKHILRSVLALYDKDAKKTILARGYWSTFFNQGSTTGTTDVTKLHLDSVQLPANTTLDAKHTWYMMGFFGGAQIDGENVSFKLNRTQKYSGRFEYYDEMSLEKVSPSKKNYQMIVPFATGWRKVQVQGKTILPTKIAGTVKTDPSIIFKPQAAFIELRVANYMSKTVHLSSELRMESNHVTTQGVYDFSALKTDNSQFNGDVPSIEVKSYWKPTGTTKPAVQADWVAVNGVHYVSTFSLANRPRNLAPVQINGDKATPGMFDGRYIIAVMPFDPKNPPEEDLQVNQKKVTLNKGVVNYQTLFFGEPSISQAPQYPTNEPASYQTDPKYLVPKFSKNFILGSTGDELKASRSYSMTLRIIRPMLPIERIYMYNSSNPGFEATRSEAESMPTNRMAQSFKDKYRLPTWSELGPLLTLNYETLKGTASAQGKILNWGPGYSRISVVTAAPGPVMLATTGKTIFDMNHYYSWTDATDKDTQKRIYGFAYQDPNYLRYNYTQKEGGYVQPKKETTNSTWNRTNMYQCAVRFIYSRDGERVRIAAYYLGPNLDIRNPYYYVMHDSFWTSTADPSGAVITRELPVSMKGDDKTIWYWGDGKLQVGGAKNPKRIPVDRSGGTYQDLHGETEQTDGTSWTIYWLKDRSW